LLLFASGFVCGLATWVIWKGLRFAADLKAARSAAGSFLEAGDRSEVDHLALEAVKRSKNRLRWQKNPNPEWLPPLVDEIPKLVKEIAAIYHPSHENPLLAPVVIACCVEKRGGEKIPFLEEVEAVACAMQNVMLSATAAGLGSFWSSPPVLGSAAFGSWLGLGEGDLCVGLLYLGWVKEGRVLAGVPRRPVAEKVVWHRESS
jgi:nitroreductase